MVNEYVVNKGDLEYIADAIREKTGTSEKLVFPSDFVKKIDSIESAGNANEIIDGLLQGGLSGELSNDRVTKINGRILENTKITKLDLPKVLSISPYGLQDCKMLTDVNLPLLSNAETGLFAGCISLKEISLPKIYSTNYGCFQNCTVLETATFSTISVIAQRTFYGCSNLKKLIIETTGKICKLSQIDAFTNTPIANGTGFIYVPDELVEQYKVETNWVTYASQIKGISEYEGEL